jgi:DNA repair protein RadC
MAGLDSDCSDGLWNMATLPKVPSESERHLTVLLEPLDQDPESLARKLIYRFGSVSSVAAASEAELRQVPHNSNHWLDALLAARQLLNDGLREELLKTNMFETVTALKRYLLSAMSCLREERMIAIFADSSGRVIAEQIIAEGEAGFVMVTARRIFGRAFNLDARCIILAHNHPSGSAEPSPCDIKQTKLLFEQGNSLGIAIHDHLIIGKNKIVSMKDRGLF